MVLILSVGMSQMVVDGGDANSQCRNVAGGWKRVCAYEEILTRVTKFDKTQQNDKHHIYEVSHGVRHMALVGLAYH